MHALPRWLVLTTSFWGGFQIMALEICGFRVLQTNLGSSVVVTGTLLTLIMVLLSIGYYTGGLLSTRFRNTRVLFALLALASVYTCVVALLLEPIAELSSVIRNALRAHTYLRSGVPAAVLTAILYGPPVFVMSMISPYWIRLQTVGSERDGGGADPGVQSGFFMSLSTVGSIVGTMVASYALLPLVGVTATALSTSLVFLALTLVGYFRSGSTSGRASVRAAAALSVIALGLAVLRASGTVHDPSVVYQAESLYGEILIRKETDDAGRSLLVYHPSRLYTHSVLYADEPLRDVEGLTYLVPGLLNTPKNILVLGSAVGGVLRAIEVAFPNAHSVGVDIDPEVHRVATELFGVHTDRSELVSADARMFLEEHREQYDMIIVDLFAGEFIPTHCITREFFTLVASHLAPGGGVFINTNMNDVHHTLAQVSEPSRPVRNLHATLRAAGFQALFENNAFHSIFAFREPRDAASLRQQLIAQLANTQLPLALRVEAGVAAYTTAPIAVHTHAAYRPYSDAWTPALSLEQKSNLATIYGALETARASSPPVTTSLAGIVLDEELRTWDHADDPEVRDLDALVRQLDVHASSLKPPSISEAVPYFHFSPDLAAPRTPAKSAWGKLAQLYADVHRLVGHNEYEQLLPVLEQMKAYL